MAGIKKKKSSGGGANWMDTYGDMVTLLLCFFVLLYSISTVDTQKWIWVIQSFNKDSVVNSDDHRVEGPSESGTEHQGGDDLPATAVEDDLQELYDFLVQYQKQSDSSSEISISMGDDYVFISFADAVFFDGDSSVLRRDGKAMLDDLIPALAQCGPSIDQLKVMGHTAQAKPTEPNPASGDRVLAASRAAVVAAYIQDGIPAEQLHPARIRDEGCGQWLNVSGNANEEERKKNRRVELVITGKDLDNALSDSYQQYYTMYESAK